jgi:L-alanine-DL-glutamate epimerase-like enolase superfamily enzyme
MHTFSADVVEPPIVVGEDGAIALPPGCGIGAEVVENRIAALTIERTTVLPH